MKLGFMSSTCPNYTVDEVIALARKLGFTSFEPRVDWKHAHGIENATPPATVRELGRKLAEAGIAVPCVASSVKTAVPAGAARQDMLDEMKRMVDLSRLVGATCVRVFGGGEKGLAEEARVGYSSETLAQAADVAAGSGVAFCLETHDFFREGRLVGQVVDAVNRPEVQVLWDITHAVVTGEPVARTAEYIKLARVKHCHVRDLFLKPAASGGFAQEPCHAFGQGDAVPYLKEAAALLAGAGFAGAFSLEVIFRPDDASHDPVAFLTQTAKGMREVFGV